MAVKRSLGKLDAPGDLVERMSAVGVRGLPLTLAHAAVLEDLPWHHRDPFDRLLVAHALHEKAAIVSRDQTLERYGVEVIW